MKKDVLKKETEFLYNKHNKNTNYKLEIEEIEFPQEIINILTKETKRTKTETQVLNKYRERQLSKMREKSYLLEAKKKKEEKEKNDIIQAKIKATKDKKLANDPDYIKHFGVWLNKKNTILNISKENYAKIDKKVYNKFPKEYLEKYHTKEQLKERYEDCDYSIYSDEWCEEHRKNCIENFELNMKFFKELKKDKFEKELNKVLKKNSEIIEIKDLDECKQKSGIYMLVLDEYKQLYIGQSNDIKRRIMQHWKRQKEFDRLLFGSVQDSVLAIDSFGALDTTRIFAIMYTERKLRTDLIFGIDTINRMEEKLTQTIPKEYQLNRTKGGIKDIGLGMALDVIANKNDRKLK